MINYFCIKTTLSLYLKFGLYFPQIHFFFQQRLFIKVTDMNPAISEGHSSCIECVCNYISAIKRQTQSALMSGTCVVGKMSESHFLGVYGATSAGKCEAVKTPGA